MNRGYDAHRDALEMSEKLAASGDHEGEQAAAAATSSYLEENADQSTGVRAVQSGTRSLVTRLEHGLLNRDEALTGFQRQRETLERYGGQDSASQTGRFWRNAANQEAKTLRVMGRDEDADGLEAKIRENPWTRKNVSLGA